MTIIVHEVEGPAFLACALINGDETGLEGRSDDRILKQFLDHVHPWEVVSTKDDEEEWFGHWNGLGMNLITYICHEHVEETNVTA